MDAAPALAPEVVLDFKPGDGAGPGGEIRAGTILGELPPQCQDCVLVNVLGIRHVGDHCVDIAKEPVLVCGQQLGKLVVGVAGFIHHVPTLRHIAVKKATKAGKTPAATVAIT
jgi:hypothetical protein